MCQRFRGICDLTRHRRESRCPGTEPHEVCGTPTTATSGAQTVTVTAQDVDANRAVADQGALTFQVEVAPPLPPASRHGQPFAAHRGEPGRRHAR